MVESSSVDTSEAAEAFERLHPLDFYRRFLKEGIRPDGRSLIEPRQVSVTAGAIKSADGSALVKIGNTSVVCGIKYEVTRPSASAPKDGRVDVRVHLGAVCSSKYKPGKPSELSLSIAEYCTRVLESSGVVNNQKLCIEEGKHVWVLRADLVCLNDDGNVADVALIALIGALRNLALPEVRVEQRDNGTSEVVQIGETCENQLELRSTPVPLSFALIDNHLLVDPSAREELVARDTIDGVFTVAMNERSEICTFFKPGGPPLTQLQVDACLKLCEQNVARICKALEAST